MQIIAIKTRSKSKRKELLLRIMHELTRFAAKLFNLINGIY